MLAKDLLNKLHSNERAHITIDIEKEATWFIKIGKLYLVQFYFCNSPCVHCDLIIHSGSGMKTCT